MNFQRVRLVMILVLIALLALITIQGFWAYDSYRQNEKIFLDNAGKALSDAVVDINDNITCFEVFSKIPINPGQGFYVVRHKWKDKEFLPAESGVVDTVPLYFDKAKERIAFQHNSLKFNYPVDLEMVLKFRYLTEKEVEGGDTMREIPAGVDLSNYKEKLSDKISLTDKYPQQVVDSILRKYFIKYGINSSFHFAYLNAADLKADFMSDGAVASEFAAPKLKQRLSTSKYFEEHYDLAIAFNNYNALIFSGIKSVLALSAIIILMLVAGFYLFIGIIFKQRKLSQLKNDFINNMTHEFKTPLANISLALETLSGKSVVQGETKEKVFRIIGQETERLNENIEKILQVARFEKGEIMLQKEKLDLHQVIQKALLSFEPILSSRNAQVDYQLAASPSWINADETHIINVICNLIDNSVKYSKNGLKLAITTRSTRDGVIIVVKDDGFGISHEAQKKIFEKFYRQPSGDMHNVKGFGLGLAYVKTIIDMHKGRIDVRSATGEGSEFEIFLPY